MRSNRFSNKSRKNFAKKIKPIDLGAEAEMISRVILQLGSIEHAFTNKQSNDMD